MADNAQSDADIARQIWEAENGVEVVDDPDQIFYFDNENLQDELRAAPWKSDVHHFTEVKMSAIALLKIVMHTTSKSVEVMGMLIGKVQGHTMIIMDAFAVPGEEIEARVNATQQAYEYMSNYLVLAHEADRLENVIGWYHSHPTFRCWLSGIDCGTQMLNQQFQDPFLAVVIDPVHTVSAGKVDIGAYRTYPEGHKPAQARSDGWQSVPTSKMEDFGAYADQYYELKMSYFRSKSDDLMFTKLWNKYWVATLSSNPLLSNRDYFAGAVSDIALKLDRAEEKLAHSGRMGTYFAQGADATKESELSKVETEASATTIEQINGLATQVVKEVLFNNCQRPACGC